VPHRPVRRRPGEGGSQTKAGLPTGNFHRPKSAPVSNRQISEILNRHALFARKWFPFPRFQTYTQKFGNGVTHSEKPICVNRRNLRTTISPSCKSTFVGFAVLVRHFPSLIKM
jgi:hypothetical protein